MGLVLSRRKRPTTIGASHGDLNSLYFFEVENVAQNQLHLGPNQLQNLSCVLPMSLNPFHILEFTILTKVSMRFSYRCVSLRFQSCSECIYTVFTVRTMDCCKGRYYDDFVVMTTPELRRNSEQSICLLFDLLGWSYRITEKGLRQTLSYRKWLRLVCTFLCKLLPVV